MHENIQKFNEMPELVTVHFFGPSGTFHSTPLSKIRLFVFSPDSVKPLPILSLNYIMFPNCTFFPWDVAFTLSCPQ